MGYLTSFFVPTPGDLTAQDSLPPGIFHPSQKNSIAPGGDWAQVELTDAQVEEGCFAGIHNMFLKVEMRIKRYTYISSTT